MCENIFHHSCVTIKIGNASYRMKWQNWWDFWQKKDNSRGQWIVRSSHPIRYPEGILLGHPIISLPPIPRMHVFDLSMSLTLSSSSNDGNVITPRWRPIHLKLLSNFSKNSRHQSHTFGQLLTPNYHILLKSSLKYDPS